MSFSKEFIWGAATAAYQIEGGHDADGKGRSVWDSFSAWKGKVFQDQNGNIACDHYHRFAEDIGLMSDIGLKGYRFSFSWSRILPQGRGTVNQAGLDFYERLLDGLLSAGIQPWATVFHWDTLWNFIIRAGG